MATNVKTNNLVYDNYFGPIAVMPDTDRPYSSRYEDVRTRITETLSRIEQARSLADRIRDWRQRFKDVAGGTSKEAFEERTLKQVRDLDPPPLKGYFENLKRGYEGIAKVQALLTDVNAHADEINQELANVTDSLHAANENALKIKQNSNTNSEGSIKLPDEYDRVSEVRKADRTLTQKVDLSNQLEVQGSLTYTEGKKVTYSSGCSPFNTSGEAYHACLEKAKKINNFVECDVIGCYKWEIKGRHNDTFAWVADGKATVATLQSKQGDQDDSRPWTVEIKCLPEADCIKWSEAGKSSTRKRATITFAKKDEAEEFISRHQKQYPKIGNERIKILKDLRGLQRGIEIFPDDLLMEKR